MDPAVDGGASRSWTGLVVPPGFCSQGPAASDREDLKTLCANTTNSKDMYLSVYCFLLGILCFLAVHTVFP